MDKNTAILLGFRGLGGAVRRLFRLRAIVGVGAGRGAAISLGLVFVAGEWSRYKIKCVKIAGNKFDYGDCGRKRLLQIYPILEVIPQKFRKFVA